MGFISILTSAHFQIFYLDALDDYHSVKCLLWFFFGHTTILSGGEFNTAMIISMAMPLKKHIDTEIPKPLFHGYYWTPEFHPLPSLLDLCSHPVPLAAILSPSSSLFPSLSRNSFFFFFN